VLPILISLCAFILEALLEHTHTSSKRRLKLFQKIVDYGEAARTASRLWLIVLRQMNNQQSLLLTHLQIKSTLSAATFKYSQISDIHKRNDMV